jgi:hypothetical protein
LYPAKMVTRHANISTACNSVQQLSKGIRQPEVEQINPYKQNER